MQLMHHVQIIATVGTYMYLPSSDSKVGACHLEHFLACRRLLRFWISGTCSRSSSVAFANTCMYTTADSIIFAQMVIAAAKYLTNVHEKNFQVGKFFMVPVAFFVTTLCTGLGMLGARQTSIAGGTDMDALYIRGAFKRVIDRVILFSGASSEQIIDVKEVVQFPIP